LLLYIPGAAEGQPDGSWCCEIGLKTDEASSRQSGIWLDFLELIVLALIDFSHAL